VLLADSFSFGANIVESPGECVLLRERLALMRFHSLMSRIRVGL
jgi:hypothetical protein